jgi:hypothetical protein
MCVDEDKRSKQYIDAEDDDEEDEEGEPEIRLGDLHRVDDPYAKALVGNPEVFKRDMGYPKGYDIYIGNDQQIYLVSKDKKHVVATGEYRA